MALINGFKMLGSKGLMSSHSLWNLKNRNKDSEVYEDEELSE